MVGLHPPLPLFFHLLSISLLFAFFFSRSLCSLPVFTVCIANTSDFMKTLLLMEATLLVENKVGEASPTQ